MKSLNKLIRNKPYETASVITTCSVDWSCRVFALSLTQDLIWESNELQIHIRNNVYTIKGVIL